MSIKIEGPNRVQGGSVRRTGRSEGSSGSGFAKQIPGEVSSAGSVNRAAPLSGLDGLLALQEVDDPTARASRGKKRAQGMLDQLDDLRMALLSGEVPREKLAELSKVVQTRRAQVDDPRLAEILDEIDLRAQVELAKFAR